MFGVNDEEVLGWGAGRHSYLFPGWTDGNLDTYFRWLVNFPDVKILRFVYGVDFGDGIKTPGFPALSELCAAATRAGVSLIPQLMHPGHPQKAKYVLGTADYSALVSYERAVMAQFDSEPSILMWDLFNEMDVFGPFSGPAQYAPWVRRLVSDVRPVIVKSLTVGHQGFFRDGLTTQADFNLMNDVVGMDITHVHWYGPDTNLSNTLGNYLGAWAKALGKPCLAGEFGSLGRYWPEFRNLWTYGDALAMYMGGFPGYPPAAPVPSIPPPPPPPPGEVIDVEARTRLSALEAWARGFR